jgi:CBS-domain-containing membrane protein
MTTVESLTAREVMSRILVIVRPDESPLMAWELMRHAGVHHLPVVDRRGHLLGILTREDLAATWSGGPDEQSRRHVAGLLRERRLARVGPEQPLPEVSGAMIDADCTAVPVITETGRLVGMVTATDVLRAVAGRAAHGPEHGEVRTGMFRLEPVPPA